MHYIKYWCDLLCGRRSPSSYILCIRKPVYLHVFWCFPFSCSFCKFFILFSVFSIKYYFWIQRQSQPKTMFEKKKKGETIILNPQLKQMRKDLNKIPWYYWHIKANKNEWKKYERIGFRIKTFSSDKPNFMKIEKHFVLVFMGYWYCVNISGIPHKFDQPQTILTLCFNLIPNSII